MEKLAYQLLIKILLIKYSKMFRLLRKIMFPKKRIKKKSTIQEALKTLILHINNSRKFLTS